MGTTPPPAPLPGFRLSQGSDHFDFDLKGSVSRNSAAFGTWSTDKQNRIVAKGADGASTTFPVAWAFNAKNQLTLTSAGRTVLTLAATAAQRPAFAAVNAVLRVKPNKPDPFLFELRPEWRMDSNHNLLLKIGDTASAIDGFVADPLGRFLYTFADKDSPLVTSVLGFVGGWEASPDGTARARFLFDKEDGSTGTFQFPHALAIRSSTNQFSYSYSKNNRSFSVQLQGILFVGADFRVSYEITRQVSSSNAELVRTTTLNFDATISKPNFEGDLTLQLKKPDGQGATLTIGGKFSGRRGETGIQVGFSYAQSFGPDNTLTRSIGFDGAISFHGAEAYWNFAASGQTVALAVGVDFRVGDFTGDLATKVVLDNGSVASVTVLLGFHF